MRTIARLTIAGALCLGILAGCGARDHITRGYGRKSRTFFQKQRVHAEPASGAPMGLDSEEAAAINGKYRKQLGAGEECGKESPSRVLLVEPTKEGKR